MSEVRPRVEAMRRRLLLGGWLVAAGAIVARSVQLQVVEQSEWQARALDQQQTSAAVPAPRGAILDRDGIVLAVSRETYKVAVAPREIDDRSSVESVLREILGLSASEAHRLTDPSDVWRPLRGHYEPTVREALAGIPGVHLERELRRHYPHGEAAQAILGRVRDGRGVGGIEEQLDDLLRGTPGREVVARDNVGHPIPGEVFVVAPPRPGGSVRLTLDLDVQEIAHQALAEAVESTGARGGDILVTEPATGDVLAMVSIEGGRADALSTINTSYEPGSTLKPFTVAGILANGVGRLDEVIDTEGGSWFVGGHALHDTRDHGTITLAEGLRVSSNVAVAKAAQALTPGMQYENLRDFGFGVPTGIPLPGESSGTLRRPSGWSARSAASLAIGYEIGVTPLQMALAYGVLANGGELMEPRLVRETRDPRGRLLERRAPRTVRRVVPSSVTRALAPVLVGVVEEGTGTQARLANFSVAGKSGTSRAYVPGVGYSRGRYFASFAGFFPADDPQLVIFVKLDSPRGPYYGGATAAPVIRATVEAVLAARRVPIDRGALLRVVKEGPVRAELSPVTFASTDAPTDPETDAVGHVAGRDDRSDEPAEVRLPELRGVSSRVAVRRLHALGFRVIWAGEGARVTDAPPAGALLPRGDTVRILSRRSDR